MWSRPYKFYNACDTVIEEAFLANVGRKGGDVGIDSSLFHEAAAKLTLQWLYSHMSDVKCYGFTGGVDRCNLFSVTMVGRRVNSFRCWSTGKSDILLPERGWRFAGLQIPSMAYPPSSTVSHFKMIFSISNLNDWLIGDGVFFVIRCIILLSNKTENKINGVPISYWFDTWFSRTKRV